MTSVIIPSFLSKEQFNDPAQCWVDDLGPIITLFVPHMEIGGMWLADERKWILQYPLMIDQHIAAVRRYLVASGGMGAAKRYCEAQGIMPPSAIN